MSRGMPSKKALAAAVPVAQVRGQVIFLRQYPGTTCDFLISEPSGLTVVSVRRSLRIRASIAEISRQFYETLTGISSAEHAPGIDREFWLWSKYGTMRFFWIEGAVLVEIDRLGVPLDPPVSAVIAAIRKTDVTVPGKHSGEPVPGKHSGEPVPGKHSGEPLPRKHSGEPVPGKNIFPEKMPVPGAGAESWSVPQPASAPGPAGPREPAPVRYLRRRARERQEAKIPPGVPGPGVPGGRPPPG